MIKNLLLIFFLTFSSSSCKWFTTAGTPFLMGTTVKAPKGTPNFQQGFRDGCSTAFYSRGNIFYRNFHGYQFNPTMIDNAEYRFGHQRGYSFCFLSILMYESGARGSFDRMLFPHGYDTGFNAGNVNEAWGGFFDGLDAPIQANPRNGFDSLFDIWGGGAGGGALSANPLWAGGSKGQFFGQ